MQTNFLDLYNYGKKTYLVGITLYNMYNYFEIARKGYKICFYSYNIINNSYNWVKKNNDKMIEIEKDWININDSFCNKNDYEKYKTM